VASLTETPAAGAVERPLIVHVVHRFSVGGLENGVVNLINHLPTDRWRHAIVALTSIDQQFAKRICAPDVQTLALDKPPGQGVWQYGRWWRVFKQLAPAIVHTRNLGALEAQVPAWLAGVPGRVHGEHGRDAADVNGTNRAHIAMRRFYRPFVHQHIALGRELATYARERVGVPDSRLNTIYNGVDTQRFVPPSGRSLIPGCPFAPDAHWLVGSVGRMQTVKAQPILARAFVRALEMNPAGRASMRLVLVGDGPLRHECESILQAADVADLAWLPGERSDVPEVMRGLDCFALPSLAEGISNTILEAMASGLPVLATRVGANAELVSHGRSGLVVEAGEVESLAAGMVALATDPDAAHRMGAAGRRIVQERFSLQAMVSAYETVYERVLGREPRSM
jgi:sugar transferase (PEP-CTERM/EpsH1 system associated)